MSYIVYSARSESLWKWKWSRENHRSTDINVWRWNGWQKLSSPKLRRCFILGSTKWFNRTPPISVATMPYNNYERLLLALAQSPLSSDVIELKNWASFRSRAHKVPRIFTGFFNLIKKALSMPTGKWQFFVFCLMVFTHGFYCTYTPEVNCVRP